MDNIELGLGLYGPRAYTIIDCLISAYRSAKRTSHSAYCTLKCTKIQTKPDGEVVLKIDHDSQPKWISNCSAWRKLETSRDVRRKLADLLKYVVSYRLGNGGYTKASDRRLFQFKRGGDPIIQVTSSEIKTLCDLVAGRRPKDAASAKELTGEPLDEIEAGLVAAKRDEQAKLKAGLQEKLDLASDANTKRQQEIQAEYDRRCDELLNWKTESMKKSESEYTSVKDRIKADLKKGLAEIEKKYSTGA